MKTLTHRLTMVLIAALLAVGLGATSASAATPGSWTVSKTHYTIYSDGQSATTYFEKLPASSVPAAAKVTTVSYQVTPYQNGNTSDQVTLCYTRPSEQYTAVCIPIAVTNSTIVTTSAFSGYSARGKFSITHTLTGGTYFAQGGTNQDTVTANYQY